MSLSTVLAKALYDNAAESPEELAFRKGDILMVLEQEQDGPGWWLCSLHGRQGIAPANRLRLLQTAQYHDARRAPSVDSVYVSPGPPNQVNGQRLPDADSVYLSPPSLTEGVYQSPGGGSGPGRRPRSHSSSGARPRPEWAEIAAEGRPRSPSLRGRGGETGSVYQSPTTVAPLGTQYRSQGTSDLVYLTPSAVPRSAGEIVNEVTYLSPRDSGTVGHSDPCYLVPRPTVAALPGEDVYQTPTNTAPVLTDGIQVKTGQEAPGMYQTPTQPGTGITRTTQTERKQPNGSVVVSPASGQNLKSSLATRPCNPSGTPLVGRGKTSQAAVRGSPLLVRTSKPGLPGSPNFARKPPPPAPPVRSVTRKDLPQQASAQTIKPTMQANPVSPLNTKEEKQRLVNKDGGVKKDTETIKQGDENEIVVSEDGKHGDQVYDTPPTNRWQHPVPVVSVDDENIYNTPRAVPLLTDQGLEIYDVPTHALNSTSDPQKQNCSGPSTVAEDLEEDVYSVPTLPGLPLDSCDMPGSVGDGVGNREVYSVPSPGKSDLVSEDVSDVDGGIYDMPALTLDIPSCRLSVSSTSSGEIQWKSSVSGLVQAALNNVSGAATSSRDLASSLAEILSIWKASHSGEVPPPLQQAWSCLAELLPALSVGGTSPPTDSLLMMVRRALEDSSLLLQCQTRPRLPSQESLSRRPLPALPVAEVKPIAGGMGSRKGSWIQERPLPPPPPPVFPLPPSSTLLPSNGQTSEDEELGNEYAGIGITPAPPSYPAGDSVGYVKLQGKPEPPPDSQIETGTSQVISTNDTRLSPSPPLPVSLSLEDSELLSFYSSQSLSHLSCLADAINSLFSSVQENQPPRIFVARGKSLIVTAHKLVFIGDTLARLLSSTDLRTKVTTSSGRLCQALKTVVVATKDAAQNYPSVQATQEMVDRVAELSQHAAGFSALLQRLAEIS